jgi:3-deoxy-D-manno-octulosonic-acid transferase
MADALTQAKAAEIVEDANGLAGALTRLFDDKPLREQRAKSAARIAANGRGTLDAVLLRLAPWLDPLAPRVRIEATADASA